MATQSSAARDADFTTRPSLTIKRRINAAPAKVYAAWTDPEKIVAMVRAREGQARLAAGRDRSARRRPLPHQLRQRDGEHYQVGGVYREVVPNERLVFSWAWHSTPERESLVTVSLKPDGAGTLLTLHHEQFFDQAARDGHESGWNGSLDKLEKYLA